MKQLFTLLAVCICLVIGCGQGPAKKLLPKDIESLKTLAEQGDANAQYNLGVINYHGRGVEQDFKESFKWYQKAAEQGYAKAQHNLGVMYGMGKGLEKNHVIAYAWASIADDNGNIIAPRYKLEFLEPKMIPEQIAKAEPLIKEMIKKNPKLIQKKE